MVFLITPTPSNSYMHTRLYTHPHPDTLVGLSATAAFDPAHALFSLSEAELMNRELLRGRNR